MKKEEFFRKLKQNNECWNVVMNHAGCKERGIRGRMNKLNRVFAEEQEKAKEILLKEDSPIRGAHSFSADHTARR